MNSNSLGLGFSEPGVRVVKTCFKCGEEKPLTEYYKHKMMNDGHLNKCKSCAKSDVRIHRKENDSVREYDRKRYKENPERRKKGSENAVRWNKANPERYKAHYLLSNAVRDGRVKKGSCEECGTIENIHGHHDDYNKPLEVRWLCAKHHHRLHAKKS